MSDVSSRISEPGAVSRRRQSFLVASTMLLLGLAVLALPARAQSSGACCASDGTCTLTTQAMCGSPSIWHLAWTTCTPNQCPQPGACCNPTTSACTTILIAACTAPRSWNGASSCLPNPCPPAGACCTPAGTCTVNTLAACAEPNMWHGAGTKCDPDPCVGACCAPAGACTVNLVAACTDPSIWHGAGTDCDPNPCIGACCTPFRACTISIQPACLSPDTWQGTGTVCAPTPCPKGPTLSKYRFLSPDTLPSGDPRPLTREDRVTLLTRWEVPNSPQLVDSLTITADFSRLDPGVPDNDAILATPEPPLGGGWYRVYYPLSNSVSRRDSSGIRIPLSARVKTGFTTDRSIEVCLSNSPPVWDSTRVVRGKDGPYRSGDSLVIETFWRSPQGLPLQVTAAFAEVDTSSVVTPGSDRGGGVFLIRYRLPLSPGQMQPDGSGKLIPITARDAEIGRAHV
jgi:hypothetical protein